MVVGGCDGNNSTGLQLQHWSQENVHSGVNTADTNNMFDVTVQDGQLDNQRETQKVSRLSLSFRLML
jgi:hypothetical protein